MEIKYVYLDSCWMAVVLDKDGNEVGRPEYAATKEKAAFLLGIQVERYPEKYFPQVEALF